jgi:hypothetical protein
MKSLYSLLIAGAFAYSASAVSTSLTLTLTESGNTITGDLNGAPVALTLTGPVDGWTIQLPDNFALNAIGSVLVGEPGGEGAGNEINEVLVGTQPQFLTWTSDIPGQPGAAALPAEVTIPDAGTFAGAPLILVLRDVNDTPTTTPDGGATAGLLFGTSSLLLMGRRLITGRR